MPIARTTAVGYAAVTGSRMHVEHAVSVRRHHHQGQGAPYWLKDDVLPHNWPHRLNKDKNTAVPTTLASVDPQSQMFQDMNDHIAKEACPQNGRCKRVLKAMWEVHNGKVRAECTTRDQHV